MLHKFHLQAEILLSNSKLEFPTEKSSCDNMTFCVPCCEIVWLAVSTHPAIPLMHSGTLGHWRQSSAFVQYRSRQQRVWYGSILSLPMQQCIKLSVSELFTSQLCSLRLSIIQMPYMPPPAQRKEARWECNRVRKKEIVFKHLHRLNL